VIASLRTAWRACPLVFAFCVTGTAAWLLLATLSGWNLAAARFLDAGIGAAGLAVTLALAIPVAHAWARSPVALRAEFRGALKPMKASEGLWSAGSGDVLLSPSFTRRQWMLIVLPAQEFWAAREYGGVYGVTAFLLPAYTPKVYRYADAARVDLAHPGETLVPPGTRRQRAKALRRAEAQGHMDATPEEIGAVLGQMKRAVPIPGTVPPPQA
jgi:hypothetical protein